MFLKALVAYDTNVFIPILILILMEVKANIRAVALASALFLPGCLEEGGVVVEVQRLPRASRVDMMDAIVTDGRNYVTGRLPVESFNPEALRVVFDSGRRRRQVFIEDPKNLENIRDYQLGRFFEYLPEDAKSQRTFNMRRLGREEFKGYVRRNYER